MSEERPRWLLKIVVVVIALGGLGWAIVRYANYQPEPPPPSDDPSPIVKKTKGPAAKPKVQTEPKK